MMIIINITKMHPIQQEVTSHSIISWSSYIFSSYTLLCSGLFGYEFIDKHVSILNSKVISGHMYQLTNTP